MTIARNQEPARGPVATALGGECLVAVLVIERVQDARPVAEALLRGGVRALEITLRTEAALPALREIARTFPEALVGAGTVLSPEQLSAVRDAGASFAVSPGATPSLLADAAGRMLPFIPGVATASEAMLAIEHGLHEVKLFNHGANRAESLAPALASVLPVLRFMITGGIDVSNVAETAALPGVFAIGGTWLAPAALIGEGNFDAIQERAREAVSRLHSSEAS